MGRFGSISSDVTAIAVADGGTGATTAAAARRNLQALGPVFDVTAYGAVGNGSTNDTAAIQAAIDAAEAAGGGIVWFPAGNYLVSATLDVGSADVVELLGVDGHLETSKITSSATSGSVLHIQRRSCRVRHLAIGATAARRAATTTTGHGIYVADADGAPSYCSRLHIEDVFITSQPTDGLHTAGGIEMSRFENITAADCKRHGIVHDDGTRSGRTNKAISAFAWRMHNVRAIECGGTGIVVGHTSETSRCRLLDARNIQALSCAYDSTARVSDHQMWILVDNSELSHIDIEDQHYANTTTGSTGAVRTGRATPSSGLRLQGNYNTVPHAFLSSLVSPVFEYISGSESLDIVHPMLLRGTYGVDAAIGFDIQNGTSDVRFIGNSVSIQATQAIRNRCVGADISIDGRQYRGLNLSPVDWEIRTLSPLDATIASGTLTVSADQVSVKGEGATADSMSTLRLASGNNGVTGLVMELLNTEAYDITITNANNIDTTTGTDLVLSRNESARFRYDGTNWVQIAAA